MSIKKFWKNIKSKQTIMGAVILALIICIAGTSTMIVPLKADDGPYQTQAYSDYAYRKEIIFDHDQVENGLTNFPTWVINTSSDYASNILTNGSDIAFYTFDNATRLSHQIEVWNKTSGELGCWVNLTKLEEGVDTHIWLYYGDADIKADKDYNVSKLWSGYTGVWHLNETNGSRIDSSSNGYDGHLYNDDGTTCYNASGKVGGALQLDLSLTQCINTTGTDVVPATGDFALEAWVKVPYEGHNMDLMNNLNDQAGRWSLTPCNTGHSDLARWYCQAGTSVNSDQNISDNEWHFITVYCTGGSWYIGVDGRHYQSAASGNRNAARPTYFGSSEYNYQVNGQSTYNGTIDEIRVQTSARNTSWFRVAYNNMNNATTTFATFGTQKGAEGGEDASVYTLKALSKNYNITWAGTAGTSVWCNSSGSNNEWLEVNMSINATDNVTCIRVWLDDLNDTGAWINASNITMYVSSDNSSYGELGSFTDGGSNCSADINSSNWNAGTMGANPFLGAGLTDTNTSIWCTFKLSIPADLSTDIFASSTKDAWKVYIGHYT